MADQDRLSAPLQESILTALAFSEDKRASILTALDPKLFEEIYRDLATRAIEYRQRYGKPPGEAHIDDLFDHVLTNPRDRRQQTYDRLLRGMMLQAEGLNIEYVVSRVREFSRRQRLKLAILESADLYEQTATRENVADEIEAILMRALNDKMLDYDVGTFMGDPSRALEFLEPDDDDYLPWGIPEFDKYGICPTRKELFLFMAPRGRGKTWFCVNLIKHANIHHWKVCYISLEMSEERIMQRLFQSFFAIGKRDEEYTSLIIQSTKDRYGGRILDGLDLEKRRTPRDLAEPDIRDYIKAEMKKSGNLLNNIVVKQFPDGELTMQGLETYLDHLEAVHAFIPDLLIVDFPDKMKMDYKNPLMAIREHFIRLRGLGVKRNMAVAVPTQPTRGGESARSLSSGHVAGDIEKFGICDNGVMYNATPQEREFGLARLFVGKGRNDRDNFSVLINQDYRTGQFVLASALMRESSYFKELEGKLGKIEAEHEGEEADADC